jgi:hypothetical protein
MQCETEWRLKRTCSHSERETEPAVERQQRAQCGKQHMVPPPNPLGKTEMIDDASCRQHCSEVEVPAEETRCLLQAIREQVVSDVDVEKA